MPVNWNTEPPVITGMVQARQESDVIAAPANAGLVEAHIASVGWNQNDDQQLSLEILLSVNNGASYYMAAKAVWTASGVWHSLHDPTTRTQPIGPVLSWERSEGMDTPTHYKIAASTDNGIAMTVRARAV